MVYIVMGVSGCGKTAISKALTKRLRIKFYDADDYHSRKSIDKMKRLIALDDSDRIPWLLNLALRIKQWNKGPGAVLACSALKKKYRRILSSKSRDKTVFIYLKGSKRLIFKRMQKRKNHFFSAGLLDSQFKILQEPRDAIMVRVDKTPRKICEEIIDKLADRQIISAAALRR